MIALSLTGCVSQQDIDDAYNDGYEAGYNSGYDEGREVGYDEGSEGWPLDNYDDGYDVGFEMGYEAARQDAIDDVIDDPIYYLGEDVILDLAEGLQESNRETSTISPDIQDRLDQLEAIGEQSEQIVNGVIPTPTPTQQPTPQQQTSVTVYVTNSGAKYHRWGCQYLWNSSIAVTLNYALSAGYTPCSRCNPPRG